MLSAVRAVSRVTQFFSSILLLSGIAIGQLTGAPAPAPQQADNRIFAQLDKLTHAKRVKSSDAVTAHLVAPAKLPNGTELLKGHEACRNHHRQGRPVENGLVVHNRGAKGGQGDDCLDGIGQSRAAPATERC